MSTALANSIAQMLQEQGYLGQNSPVQSPTINNAPPAGQNTINFNPRNPDPRITIDEAPPVYQNPQYNDWERLFMAMRDEYLNR